MTTGDQLLAVRRQRTERRLLPPFGDGSDPNQLSSLLDKALAGCRFAPFPDRPLRDDGVWVLEELDAARVLAPSFNLVVDGLDDLGRHLGLQPDDLSVGLSARSRHLRRYQVLGDWNVEALPAAQWQPAPSVLHDSHTGRGLDFVVSLRVTGQREPLAEQGLAPGRVLCRRQFVIKEPPAFQDFPMEWTDFDGSRYPRESLWVIEWHDGDGDPYDRPVDEALLVRVNRRLEQPLAAMDRVPGGKNLAWKLLAADIATQIWADVLANADEPESSETESLAGQIYARLHLHSGKPYADLGSLTRQDDSLGELRALVAKILGVVP